MGDARRSWLSPQGCGVVDPRQHFFGAAIDGHVVPLDAHLPRLHEDEAGHARGPPAAALTVGSRGRPAPRRADRARRGTGGRGASGSARGAG